MAKSGNPVPAVELVPVGQVFLVFPAKYDGGYPGIEVTDNSFCPHSTLIFQDPNDSTDQVRVAVSTIEWERKRANVAHPGKQYGVKLAHTPRRDIKIGDLVFVSKSCANKAAQIEQQFTGRPSKFQDLQAQEARAKHYHA
jgi:hypothetical protein